MSAEALRAFTVEKVNREAEMYVDELVELTEATLDRMRYSQGFIAGLKRAVELQSEAYKGMSM